MAEKSTARIAFIGAGGHSTHSLYPNIAHIPEFDLVAVCDLDETRAANAARRFGAREHFTDFEKMLNTIAPDGVCICGSADMHYAVALSCLSHGFPVFVEKPPAPDFEHCKKLVAEAQKNHTFGMVGFMKRFAPANLVTAEFMQSNTFGKLSTISAIHGCGPYDDFHRMMNFNGMHLVDLVRFLGGDIKILSACAGNPKETCKAVVINFLFCNGAIGSLNVNSGHSWQDCFEQTYVSGTGAALLTDGSKTVEVMAPDRRFAKGEGLELYGWSSRYYVSGNMSGWWPSGHYTRGYWGELNHFAHACLGRVEPKSTFSDGLEAMRFIEAVMISVREEGRPVHLAEVT